MKLVGYDPNKIRSLPFYCNGEEIRYSMANKTEELMLVKFIENLEINGVTFVSVPSIQHYINGN